MLNNDNLESILKELIKYRLTLKKVSNDDCVINYHFTNAIPEIINYSLNGLKDIDSINVNCLHAVLCEVVLAIYDDLISGELSKYVYPELYIESLAIDIYYKIDSNNVLTFSEASFKEEFKNYIKSGDINVKPSLKNLFMYVYQELNGDINKIDDYLDSFSMLAIEKIYHIKFNK